MYVDGEVITEHVSEIIKKHSNPTDYIEETRSFLYDMLDPTPDRGDMLYRYEHCIRVAENGKMLAKAEGLPKEPLVMACLLHDVGYRESDRFGGFSIHHLVSADIAKAYLDAIGYDEKFRDEMVIGISRHNATDNIPEDMSVFQMSIRDCDDLDRFDIIRISMALGSCVHEKTNVEIIESCQKAIDLANWHKTLKRGTKTADELFKALCDKRISLLQEIIDQANKGFNY